MFAILGILAVAGAVGLIAVADDSSAATFGITPSGDDYGKTGTDLTYVLGYTIDNATATFTAELVDRDGDKVTATVSPSAGTIYDSSNTRSLKITLPSAAGEYALKVTIKDGETEYVRYAAVEAVEPVVLSATVENIGSASRTFMVYFYLEDDNGDWNKIDGSGKTVTVAPKATQTVTYEYVVKDIEPGTFCIIAEDGNVGGEIQGLGTEHAHSFYTKANDYRIIEYTCVAIIVILLFVTLWIYRKPVKNLGKPKARR